MHDFLFDHVHVRPHGRDALDQAIWAADNIELVTVGIDIGSSTSHLMFARLGLRRLATGISSRFVTVKREILWRSPILLTPYRTDALIDAELLGQFIRGCYDEAGLDPDAIDSGAVILTGVAGARANAQGVAELFADVVGKFVCASAGHRLEAMMAAHGSGAVALSRTHRATLLNVDLGGGTTKFSLVRDGESVGEAAIAVGARLIVETDQHRLIRVEEPARRVALSLGFELAPGATLTPDRRRRLAARMAELVIGAMRGDAPDALARDLLLTEPLPDWRQDPGLAPTAVVFSGGVAEYLFEREHRRFGDLGPDLAHALQHALTDRRIPATVWDTGQGIRATVIGAAQFTLQVSGSTILITHPDRLPVRNLPVVLCPFDLPETIESGAIARTVRDAVAQAGQACDGGPLALAFAWRGEPLHARLHALASGICAALPATLNANPGLVLLIDGDVGQSLGRIITTEIAPGAALAAIDSVACGQFDYVDLGAVIRPAGVVPLIVKSLVF